MKTKKKSSLQFSPIFRPKSGEDQKKKRSSLNSMVLGVGQKQRSSPTICVLKASAQVTKGGHSAILNTKLCELYYPGDPKGGGHGPMAPPKYAPGRRCLFLAPTQRNRTKRPFFFWSSQFWAKNRKKSDWIEVKQCSFRPLFFSNFPRLLAPLFKIGTFLVLTYKRINWKRMY